MDQLLCRVNQSRNRCEALLTASSRLVRVPAATPANRRPRPAPAPRSRRASSKRA
jgi:hypothetical protein